MPPNTISGKVTGYGVVVVLYPGSAAWAMQVEFAPALAGAPDEANVEVLDTVAPGANHYVHARAPTDEVGYYRARHVRDGYADGDPTAWIGALPEPLPDDIPLLLQQTPATPLIDFDLAIAEDGKVTITVDGEPVVDSVRWAHSTTTWPDEAAIAAGAAVNTDADGDATIADAFTLAGGQTGYVAVRFYTGAGGTGEVLGTLRQTVHYLSLLGGEPAGHDWEFGGVFRDVPFLQWTLPAEPNGVAAIEVRQWGGTWETSDGGVFNPGQDHVFRGYASEWKATWEQVVANPSRSYTFAMMAHFHNGSTSAVQGPVTVTNAQPSAAALTLLGWKKWNRIMAVSFSGFNSAGATYVSLHMELGTSAFTPDADNRVGGKSVSYKGSGFDREEIRMDAPVDEAIELGQDMRWFLTLSDELTPLLHDEVTKDVGQQTFGGIPTADSGVPTITRGATLAEFPASPKHNDIFIHTTPVPHIWYIYDGVDTLAWQKTTPEHALEIEGEKTIKKQATAPSSPALDDLWLDTSTTVYVLKRWNGSAWVKATPTVASEVGAEKTVSKQTTPPSSPATNDLWIDTTTTPHKWRRWNGSAWVYMGAQAPVDIGAQTDVFMQSTFPSSPQEGDIWYDTSFSPPVVKIRSGGAWVRSDALFIAELDEDITSVHVDTDERSGAGRAFIALDTSNRLADPKKSQMSLVGNRQALLYGWGGNLVAYVLEGASYDVDVQAFSMRIDGFVISFPGPSRIQVNSASNATVRYVYCDNPAFDGASITYQATTSKETVIGPSSGGPSGRVFVGEVPAGDPGGGCVATDMLVDLDGRTALDARPGDALIVRGRGDRVERRPVLRASEWRPCNCVRIAARGGAELVCSIDTPFTLRNGASIAALFVDGAELLVCYDGRRFRWERVRARFVGAKRVVPLYLGGREFAAGREPGRMIVSHNALKT